MSQNDYVIGNQTAPNFRSDLNDALQALASLSSGSAAPSTTYANMLWYDTGNNILKMRTEADDAWIDIGYLDQSANAFRLLNDTQVTDTSGTQTGLLGAQATSAWETGTATTESLVSPAKVKAAVEALGGDLEALAEGASGAPKVQGVALDNVFLGGVISDTTWTGFSDLDRVSRLYFSGPGATARDNDSNFNFKGLQFRFSTDNGATWPTTFNVFLDNDDNAVFSLKDWTIDLESGEYSVLGGSNSDSFDSGTSTLPSGNVNAFQFRWLTGALGSKYIGYALIIGGKT